MNKILKIEGMTCGHCKMKVENVLNALNNVDNAEVDLIDGSCEVEMSKDIDLQELTAIISDAGYKLIAVN